MKLLMHPDTAKLVKGQFASLKLGDSDVRLAGNGLFRMEIVESQFMDRTRWDERWVPPNGGRFFELTSRDESWARPLGLGHVEKIDMGPLIIEINDKAMEMMALPMQYATGFFSPPMLTPRGMSTSDMPSLSELIRTMGAF